ncbi:MAG: response regulator [Candidatus Zixiibacteriota bacterium]
MKANSRPITILLAEDDPDDALMAREALEDNRLCNELVIVEDGEQLMNYLNCRNEFSDRSPDNLPGLILLDLNMPKKDGREALKEIKSNPKLRLIPIVVLTTSKAEEDILRTYDLGVNSFITKPVSFESLVDIMKTLSRYWFEIVDLPTCLTGV